MDFLEAVHATLVYEPQEFRCGSIYEPLTMTRADTFKHKIEIEILFLSRFYSRRGLERMADKAGLIPISLHPRSYTKELLLVPDYSFVWKAILVQLLEIHFWLAYYKFTISARFRFIQHHLRRGSVSPSQKYSRWHRFELNELSGWSRSRPWNVPWPEADA